MKKLLILTLTLCVSFIAGCGGGSPAANRRDLHYQVEVELKITRSLREDEGRPIVRVRTPGRPLDPARPVDIEIGVEA